MNPILDPGNHVAVAVVGSREAFAGIMIMNRYMTIWRCMRQWCMICFDYLSRHPHAHLKEIGKDTKSVAVEVFKRFINIGLVRGGKSGNWNVNGWNMMLRPVLVLDSNEAYPDGKGKNII